MKNHEKISSQPTTRPLNLRQVRKKGKSVHNLAPNKTDIITETKTC